MSVKQVPERWKANYKKGLWFTETQFLQLIEELGAAEAKVRELEQERDHDTLSNFGLRNQ